MRDWALTLLALGPTNLARVAAYRFGLRFGWHPVLRLAGQAPNGPFFSNRALPRGDAIATNLWQDEAFLFSAHRFPLKGTPDWHANLFRPGIRADSETHWSRIPDFDASVGDIKTVWELSRLDWLVAMAQRASLGDDDELARLNAWLDGWCKANPPYRGANWKCGQEASIRVMHLALAALILGETTAPLRGLRDLLALHLARIAPTISYAIGQQNNHGTSEAAALFIGGSWFAQLGDSRGARWAKKGRAWLENRAKVLIEPDGTFSQYSVNYHRVVLDTYALAEVWRRHLRLPGFSAELTGRLRAATLWLQQMVAPATGDAPNFGANDGARLLPLTDTPYRDFRPSLQLAAGLFCGARAVEKPGVWDQPAKWLAVEPQTSVLPVPLSRSFDNGGVHVLRRGRAVVYFRYPRFRFRPSHADVLHVDVWIDGENLLRDGGSYSYGESMADFLNLSGSASHNTVEFDGRDQMPRLGRFLFGSWPRAQDVSQVTTDSDGVRAAAAYCDREKAYHKRSLSLLDDKMICFDQLAGNAKRATLRWRLQPGNWRRHGLQVENGPTRLSVTCDRPVLRAEIVEGVESREYLSKSPLPVFEIECAVPAVLRTEVHF